MGADGPERGDWFVTPNAATGLYAPERDGVHRCIVKSSWVGPQITLLPRSASRDDGRAHPAHERQCGAVTCRLDRDGWIAARVISVYEKDIGDFSCPEPDDEVVDWAMSIRPTPEQRRGRRP